MSHPASIHEKMDNLKVDLRKLVFLVIRELMNDFAVYNKFPQLKDNINGVKINGNIYDKEYFHDLLEELKGDFVLGLCYLYSISYVDFVNHCLTNKNIYADGVDIDSKRDSKRNRSDRRLRSLVKSLKVKKK